MKDFVTGWHLWINHMNNLSSLKKFFPVEMLYNYSLLLIALVILFFINQDVDDDDDHGGGMMVPAYQNQ